jgi:hypothetical protein
VQCLVYCRDDYDCELVYLVAEMTDNKKLVRTTKRTVVKSQQFWQNSLKLTVWEMLPLEGVDETSCGSLKINVHTTFDPD